MSRLPARLLLCLLGLLSAPHLAADYSAGADWLEGQIQPDGSIASDQPLASTWQASAAGAEALAFAGRDDSGPLANVRGYLSSSDRSTSYRLARRILTGATGPSDLPSLVARLRQLQGPDGAFGARAGYTGTILDTALALRALSAAGVAPDDPAVTAAANVLLNRQSAAGSWAVGDGANEVFVTAQAMRGLQPSVTRTTVASALDDARQWVLEQRGSDGSLGETWRTAAGILAVAPNAPSKTVYSDTVAALRDAQHSDGSWSGDAFTTALAVQALTLASRPQPNPSLGGIALNVVDAESGTPVEGAEVSLTGPENRTRSTPVDGVVALERLPAGDYELEITENTHAPIKGQVSLDPGEKRDLGNVKLLRATNTGQAVLRGSVTHAQSGAPVSNAAIEVSGSATASTTTTAEGRFRLDNLEPGGVDIRVSADAFRDTRGSVQLQADTVAAFNVGLDPVSDTAVTVTGTVTAADSGAALSGAHVAVTGADTGSAETDANGDYQIANLDAGELTITVDADGYESASARVAADDGQTLRFSPALSAEGETPADPETGNLTGTVVAQATDSPIQGVTVIARADGIERQMDTDATGGFSVNDLPAGTATLELHHPDYSNRSLAVDVSAGITLDLGSIALDSGTGTGVDVTGRVVDSLSGEPVGQAKLKLAVGQWKRVNLRRDYDNPVVVAGPATHNNDRSLSVRVRNVTSDSFEISLQMPCKDASLYSGDGPCEPQAWAEEKVAYVVMEEGVWQLPDGTRVEAHRTEVDSVKATFGPGTDKPLELDFAHDYNQSPAVLHQVMSARDPAWITTTAWGDRWSNDPPARDAFTLALEGGAVNGDHGAEMVGWIAVSPASSSVSGTAYQSGTTASRNARIVEGHGDGCFDLAQPGFDRTAFTLVSQNSRDGGDGGWMRFCDNGNTSIAVHVDEDRFHDSERRHNPEHAAWLSFERALAGNLMAADGSQGHFEIGSTSLNTPVVPRQTTTSSDGVFRFAAMRSGQGDMTLSADGYQGESRPIYFTINNRDLGNVRIRRKGVLTAEPDLVARGVAGFTTTRTDTGFRYDGQITAEWENQGAVPAEPPFLLRAFVDVDGDGNLDESDRLLGRTEVARSVPVGEEQSTRIPVSGAADFPGAPPTLAVDAGGDVVESDESNNVVTRDFDCRQQPPSTAELEPQVQWSSRGVYAGHEHETATGPPAVGQFNDDNGDGRIDQDDVPDVVIGMGAGGNRNSDTMLGVFSGDDGELAWAYHDESGVRVSNRATPAIGDIDDDGKNEIITNSFDGSRLLRFEHDGTLTWNIDSRQRGRSRKSASHAPLIANLDQQGLPEIVIGRTAFSAEGNLLWEGAEDHGALRDEYWGVVSIAADIHPSPGMEVSAGRTLYASDGSVIWHRDELPDDGTTAVGNFDEDDNAELIYVGNGRVALLQHTGDITWTTDLGTRGPGGPPTVADFDGDGRAEFGIAGEDRYTVFEEDGTVKWTAANDDDSSRATGSSVFDFNADGRAEVLYADEREFRIFDGTTGETLTSIQNSSITKLEYPIVANVDKDIGAEIVLTSNPHTGEVDGLRVFEAANGQWAPTRSIWNQHSYHIDNINDDGSIPVEEEKSWQTHNTYRLNTFPGRDALDQPDLVASGFELIDNGIGEPASLRMRVGSAGALASEEDIRVTFYDGAPDAGGTELGTTTVHKLRPGAFSDVELDGVDPAALSGDDLYAHIDPRERMIECREDNNRARTPPVTASTLGSIEVGTDASSYTPDEAAQVSAEATNQGRFSGHFSASLRVVDPGGATVAEFGRTDLGELDSGATASVSESWAFADTLAGSYTVVAELRDHDGQVVDRAIAGLNLLAAVDGEPLATLRTATDRAVYSPSARVRVDNLAENVTTNGIIAQARLTTVITQPDGSEYDRYTTGLGDLAAGAVRQRQLEVPLSGVPEGDWTVTARLHDGDDRLMATGSDSFTVERKPANRVQGSVEALHAERTPGEPQTCTEELSNPLDRPAKGLEIRRLVLNLTGEEAIKTETTVLDLAAGESIQRQHGFDTSGLEEGSYSCVLQVNTDTGWRNLGRADFRMKEPPINIQPSVEAGDHGRVLILIDPPDAGTGRGDDAHGPKDTPGAEAQRDWLEARLDEVGWSYTIVTAGNAFRDELRTDQYAAVALFHEHVKIAEAVQHELVDRVKNNGLGLLVAGMHDRRNGRIEPALGLKSKGKLPHVDGLYLYDSEVTTADQFDFPVDGKPLRLDLQGANSIGKYTSDHPGGGSGNKGKAKGKGKGKGKGGQGKGPKKPGPALTTFEHGEGLSVDAGFDLLLQGTAAGGANRFSELMLNALEHVHPDLEPRTHLAWPVKATLSNQGIATPGRLVLTLPAGAQVADAGPGTVNDAGQLIWTWQLDVGATRSATFWIRLPDEPGNAIFDAAIQTGTAPDWQPHRQVEYILNVLSDD